MARKQRGGTLLWAGAALLISGCGGSGNMVLGPNPQSSVSPVDTPASPSPAPAKAAAAAVPSAHSLADVHSWTAPAAVPAQTPAATLTALEADTASLLIVHPSLLPAGTPQAKPLAALQKGGRRVLAWLPISETDKTNPPFWNADWQKRTETALSALVADGYSGVCLQGVSDYRSFLKARPTAAAEMASFIEVLATQARAKNPAFGILPDGGAQLPGALSPAQAKVYLNSVDGILAQDVFYPGDKPVDNPLAPDTKRLTALHLFQQAGKPVFVTERLTNPAKIADFLMRAKSLGFLPDAALTPPSLSPSPPQVADAR